MLWIKDMSDEEIERLEEEIYRDVKEAMKIPDWPDPQIEMGNRIEDLLVRFGLYGLSNAVGHIIDIMEKAKRGL